MFRKIVLALSVSTALCAPGMARAETLSDTVSQALLSHPQMKASQASLAAANKGVQEQWSAFFPVLNVGAGAGRLYNNDDTTRGATPNGTGASSWVGEGSVTVTQPIFSGFSVLNHVRSARDRAAAETYSLTGTGEDIALRAARAHLNFMRTRELLDLASAHLADIEVRRKNISLMVKEGAADEAELLQADEAHMVARNTRLGYEEAFHQAEADYIEAVGAGPVEKLQLGSARWNGLIPPTLDEAMNYASAKNARVLAANSLVSAAEKDAKAEKGSLLPHVDAEMSYSKKDQRDAVGGEALSGQAMIRMGWSFASGGGQIARISRMQAVREEAFAKRQGVLRMVEHDVRQKYTSMQIVDQQFSLLSEREKSSQDILKNYLAQYEGGKQSNLQLIGAHVKLFEAKAARIDAHYRQLLSRFELLNATGRLREAFADVKSDAKQKG